MLSCRRWLYWQSLTALIGTSPSSVLDIVSLLASPFKNIEIGSSGMIQFACPRDIEGHRLKSWAAPFVRGVLPTAASLAVSCPPALTNLPAMPNWAQQIMHRK